MTTLAAYLAVNKATIHRWESGQTQPSFATLVKLANYFGVSVDYLLHNDFDYLDFRHNCFIDLGENDLHKLINQQIRGLNRFELSAIAAMIKRLIDDKGK